MNFVLLVFAIGLGVMILFVAAGRESLKKYIPESYDAQYARDIGMMLGILAGLSALFGIFVALSSSTPEFDGGWATLVAYGLIVVFGLAMMFWLKNQSTVLAECSKQPKQHLGANRSLQ